MASLDGRQQALVALGEELRAAGYAFVAPTPATQARVDRRPGNAEARSVRDVFGWSRPFRQAVLPPRMLELLRAAEACVPSGGLQRSTVRFSTLRDRLFVHSAHPTTDADAVFFGPDTIRFAGLLERAVPRATRLVDVGCGSGAGGLIVADRCARVVLADVSDTALRFTAVNVALNLASLGVAEASIERVRSDVLDGVAGAFDVVIANPPYLADPLGRTYRDGGGEHGEALSLRIVADALRRLSAGGTLVLYTGVAIVDGEDRFRREAMALVEGAGATATYEELDPDVFGEELETERYAAVDRIAAVALCVRARGR